MKRLQNLLSLLGPKTKGIVNSQQKIKNFVALGVYAVRQALGTTPMAYNAVLLEAIEVTEAMGKGENVEGRDEVAVRAVQQLMAEESKNAAGNMITVSMVNDLLTSAHSLMGGLPVPIKTGAAMMMGAVITMTAPTIIKQNMLPAKAETTLGEIAERMNEL